MKKRMSVAMAVLLCVVMLFLTACGNTDEQSANSNTDANQASPETPEQETDEPDDSEAEPATRTVKHKTGELVIPNDPQNVVDMGWYSDVLLSLGVADRLTAAVSGNSWAGFIYPKYLDGKLRSDITVIENEYEPNLEQLLSLQPDLILSYEGLEANEAMSKIAPVYIIDCEWGDFKCQLEKMGEVFGLEEEAKQVTAEYDSKAADAKVQLDTAVGDESVMFVRISDKFYRVYGTSNQSGRLLYNDLGLSIMKDWTTDPEQQIQDLTMEGLFAFNADHMIIVVNEGEEPMKRYEELQQSEVWKSLEAVKNNQVYLLPEGENFIYYATGPVGSSVLIDRVLEWMVK